MSRMKSAVYGSLSGIVFILICLIFSSIIYLKYDFDATFISLIMQVIYFAGSFLAGFISGRLFGRNGIISGLIASLVIAFLCVAFSIFFGDNLLTMTLILTIIVIVGSGISGGVFSLNVGKNKTP